MGLNAKGYRGVIKKDLCVFCAEPFDERKVIVGGQPHPNPRRFTADHIHPKGKGGGNHWMNIAATCSRCNNSKGNNSLLGHLLGERIDGRFALGHSYKDYQWEGDVQATGGRWRDPLGIKVWSRDGN